MLKVNKNVEIYEATSEVEGKTIMTFQAMIDKDHPVNSTMDVKKESEQLYRTFRGQASLDRKEFEDLVFKRIYDLENPKPVDVPDVSNPEVIDGDFVEAPVEIPVESENVEEVTEDAEN